MSTRHNHTFVVLLLAATVAPSTSPLAAQTPPARHAMATRLTSYADALKRGNDKAAALLFTHDALLITSSGELRGAAALDSALSRLFATATVTEATLTITGVEVSDTTASSVGCYTEVLSRTDRPVERHAGMYIAVWRRESEGDWKIRRIISTEAVTC